MNVLKATVILCLVFVLNGCAVFKTQEISYLTNKDETWIIPKGEPFNAIANDGKLAQRRALDDLVVLYKGKLLELEKEADMRVLKMVKKGNNKAVLSGVGTLIASVVGAWFAMKKKKK